MKARDVMVSPVVTVMPYSSVKEVAKILIEKSISAVPVIDDSGKIVGIVSESDLMHRSEAGTERQRSWWLRLMARDDMLAADYVKAHGRKITDVMTRNVITATPDMPLDEIAILLEINSIKRVPIVKNGQLVGIVSRANLVQAVASAPTGAGNSSHRFSHSRQVACSLEGTAMGAYWAVERHSERRGRIPLGHHEFRRRTEGNLHRCGNNARRSHGERPSDSTALRVRNLTTIGIF